MTGSLDFLHVSAPTTTGGSVSAESAQLQQERGFYLFGWVATQACLITIPEQINGGRSKAQNSHTLPPQHWLVKNNCHKLRPEPVCDPQSNHGSCVLFLDVKVVEHHGLGLR